MAGEQHGRRQHRPGLRWVCAELWRQGRSLSRERPATWRLILEYDGAAFAGWQRQPGDQRTIQGEVERALTKVLGGEPGKVLASGRTDAGVHALGQVVSFRACAPRTARALRDGLNATLPPDISALHVAPARHEFNAMRDSTGKLYRYVLRQGPARRALLSQRVWQVRYPMDRDAMQSALDRLVGEHDFGSFRATGCAARTSVRRILSARARPVDDALWIEIYGAGFLRHMVRIIVGSLVDVGRGRRPPGWFDQLLATPDRTSAGKTAISDGLFLVRVDYPAEALLAPRTL